MRVDRTARVLPVNPIAFAAGQAWHPARLPIPYALLAAAWCSRDDASLHQSGRGSSCLQLPI